MTGGSDGGTATVDRDPAARADRWPSRGLVVATAYAFVIVGVGYDYLLAPDAPSVPVLEIDLAALDWLYVLALLTIGSFVVVPLVENPRMRRHYWREFRSNRAAVVSLGYLAAIFVVGSIGPRVVAEPQVAPRNAYQPPVFASTEAWLPLECAGEVADGRCHGTWDHPFGTTHEGKDVLAAVIYGMEVSLQVGLIGALLAITVATLVGLTAAYFGGWVDAVLMRYVDIQLTFPTFFLYLLVVYLYGGSLLSMIVIFGLLGWGGIARIVRSEGLQRREETYVMAAKNAGAGGLWTIRKHLLPNVSGSVVTAATLLIPTLILYEASLAFLGLGDPTVPSWGEVIASGRTNLVTAWWVSTIPGIFLFATILAFNFVGDALRDAIDPRSAGRSR